MVSVVSVCITMVRKVCICSVRKESEVGMDGVFPLGFYTGKYRN